MQGLVNNQNEHCLRLGSVRFQYRNEDKGKIEIIPGTIIKENERLLINFRYHGKLKDEIKALESPRWHGYDEINPRKIWSVKDSQANRFQLAYLTGLNPYQPYDAPLVSFTPKRHFLYNHQRETAAFELTRRQCIVAEEVGIGKTLATFECAEYTVANRVITQGAIIWVGPRSALDSVRYEQYKWKPSVEIIFMSYDEVISALSIKNTAIIVISSINNLVKSFFQIQLELSQFHLSTHPSLTVANPSSY